MEVVDPCQTTVGIEEPDSSSLLQLLIEECEFFFIRDLLLKYGLEEDEIYSLSIKKADEQLFEKNGWDEILSIDKEEHYNYSHYYEVLLGNIVSISNKTLNSIENEHITYRKSISVREGLSETLPDYIVECKKLGDRVYWTIYLLPKQA